MSFLEEPDLSTLSLDVDIFRQGGVFVIDKASDTDETEDLSAEIRTPSETTAEPDDEPDGTEPDETPTTPESPIPLPTSWWWKGTDPTAALFTPIPPPDVKFEPLPLTSPPNSYHPNAITAANERPLLPTQFASPVANLGPLWSPQVLPTTPEEPASTVSNDDMVDAWWNVSDETQHIHDTTASSARTLHRITTTGRTGWRKETRKIVENLDIVLGHAVVSKQTWSDFLSGGQDPDFGETSLCARKAVQRSAEAVQQLVFLTSAVSSEVSRRRSWQWFTWMKSNETISPTDAAAYLRAKMEARQALDRARAAVDQAVVAAKATYDYK